MWVEPEPQNGGISGIMRTAYRKKLFLQTNGTEGNVYSDTTEKNWVSETHFIPYPT